MVATVWDRVALWTVSRLAGLPDGVLQLFHQFISQRPFRNPARMYNSSTRNLWPVDLAFIGSTQLSHLVKSLGIHTI
jgi:hypothetical protein